MEGAVTGETAADELALLYTLSKNTMFSLKSLFYMLYNLFINAYRYKKYLER